MKKVCVLVLLVFLPGFGQAASLEVREKINSFESDVVGYQTKPTFVITTKIPGEKLAPPAPPKPRIAVRFSAPSGRDSSPAGAMGGAGQREKDRDIQSGHGALAAMQQKATGAECDFDNVLFGLDSPTPSPSSLDALLKSIVQCRAETRAVSIVGHTCSLGSSEHNQTLSRQRAEAVAEIFSKSGYRVLSIKASGESDPLTFDPNKRYLNRRVEIHTSN